MTKKILLSVTLGMILGLFLPESFGVINDYLMDIGLCALLFFVGIDLGRSNDVFVQIKELGFKVLLIPLAIALGSIAGGIIVGLFLDYQWNEGAAVASGLAWYSLAPVIIAPYSAELGAVAFLSNVTRELLAVISIPFIAKYIGFYEAIAPTGAAGMDTMLPIVAGETDSTTAVVCFVSGVVLTFMVPFLVSFFIAL